MLLYRFTALIPFNRLESLDVDALPLKAAVIVPALKLPDASRATIVDAVLALVALDVTVNVAAADPL